MANKKISQLTEVTTPNATDVIPVVNASETKKTQLGNLPISDATQSALDGKQDTLGYTAENVANRSTDVDADKTSLTKYPVVKAVYDWAVSLFATISQLNTKQDTLVSGTNIKTINSTSLLGSGDIAIDVDLSPISVDGDKVSIAADSTATTQTTAVIQATDTNSGIAIVPNGTGAITAQVPDGTTVGGNARGNYSVDFQRTRINANDGARGNRGFIGNGYSNEIGTISYGAIVNGLSNTCNAELGFIGNGESNFLSSVQNVITGGKSNTNSSAYGVISGGQSNTASSNQYATVVGGYQNSSTGQYSVSGGYSNVASGQGSVALGYDNTASGSYSIAIGENCTASAGRSYVIGTNSTVGGSGARSGIFCSNGSTISDQYAAIIGGSENNIAAGSRSSFIGGGLQNEVLKYYGSAIGGRRAKSYLYNHSVNAGGQFASKGDAQQSNLVARKSDTLTTGATTTLSLDGTGTTELIIPDGTNRVWNVTIKYTAVVTSITGTATGVSVGDCKNEVLTIGFKKIGGTSSVVGSLNTISTNEDSSMSTASFGVSAGASQEMKLDFTAPTFSGGGSVTTRVVAKVELTEVAY